ncbi:MAG: DUF2288 domain-containing protein [Cyanophyceae cyanobacterium]
MPTIREQLTEELASVAWSTLIPHAKRDAVIVVNDTLNLLDVGEAIAQDDSALVQNWISRELIHKPYANQLTAWNSEPGKAFMTLIVQPFVIVQEARAVDAEP